MTLKIFPYVLVRYASMPFHMLELLQLPGISEYVTHAAQLQSALLLQRETLCNQLYTAVEAQEDNRKRQRLLQLKRDVFNGKIPALNDAALIEPGSPLHTDWQAYGLLYTQWQQWQQDWELSFNEQVTRHRQQLQHWTQEELLRNGILLSSPVLYGQLDSFAAAHPAAFRNRELKNEYSLLRYITRMAGKTSPFSTFTYTGIATPDAGQPHFLQPSLHPAINSSVRLNNSLFAYIRALMIHHPVMNEILEVRLNMTAEIREEQLSFLVNYFNVEAFQRLPARNLPLWLYHFLQERAGPVSMKELIDLLAAQIPDTDRENIKSFLLKLAASGFLEMGIGCSGVDPAWDTAFARFLQPHADQYPAVERLYELLLLLAHRKTAYEGAASRQRHVLLQETAAALNHLLGALQEEAGLPVVTSSDTAAAVADTVDTTPSSFEVNRFAPRYFSPQEIFYEDACTSEKTGLPANAIQIFTEKADLLCTLLEPEDALQEERLRMRNFFLQHYGPAHQENITGFYHAYYLHEKKQAQADKQAQAGQRVKTMTIPDTMQLTIGPSQANLSAKTAVPAANGAARGMFVQFYNREQNGAPLLHGVINAPLPGLGKVAGRFLHLFDGAVTSRFREWNTALHREQMMMELNDGSTFNANIHPPLLSYEIGMPGGNNNYPPDGQVSLKEVFVRYETGKDQLSLYHTGTGKEIYAYDLCLESFYNRSHFYQLLAHFNPEQRLPFRQLIAAVDQRFMLEFPQQEAVQVKPRITFEEQVVIRRKGWLIKTAGIPQQQNGETDAAYFIRLHTWREQQQLPEHVFLFLRSSYIGMAPGSRHQLQRDDYKPQYICFTQPLLVNLLKKLLSRAAEYCYLEEMLPHATDLQQHGTAATVTEYMLHWYKY